MKNDLKNKLFKMQANEYGIKYQEHLLGQYKMYVSLLEQVIEKRQKSNHLFLAIHTALLAILGFVNKEIHGSVYLINILISISGMAICYSWYRLIRSYQNINASKFKVIHKIEERLPLSLYSVEWDLLGRGQDKKIYYPITSTELIIPIIFTIIYITLIFLSLFVL